MRRSFSSAVRFGSVGAPKDVLRVQAAAAALADPSPGHVVVRLEASALHPADLRVVRGLTDACGPQAAAAGGPLGGSEGAGVVERVGPRATGVAVGDHVLVAALGAGTWTARGAYPSSAVFRLDKSTPFERAATLSPVCAALQMLSDANLQAGDVVLHVGAPGAVGLALAQIAAKQKLRLVSVIENGPNVDASVALLKEHGAFAAVTADYARSAAFRRLLSDLPRPALALNGLGGRAATDALRLLAPGRQLVTYAGRPFHVPASHLVDRNISVRGFNINSLFAQQHAQAQELVSKAEKLDIKLLIERFALSKFPAALARHEEPFRNRKVVLLNGQ